MEHYIKSNENSTRLREVGNQFYSKRNFFNAIIKYNESLCYAENQSENLGLAYANRSAVYFEMKLYEKSLANIQLARASNYPEKTLEVLDKREEKCRFMMKNSLKTSNSSIFKLSHEPRASYPFVVNCLELKSDAKYGRYLVSNRNLSVGDVIVMEEPIFKILKEQYLSQRCSYCLKSNLLDLIPCESCTRAMYCSKLCADNAYQSYHRFECSLSRLINSSFLNVNMKTALRVFFMALGYFDDSVADLLSYLEEEHSCTPFDIQNDSTVKEKLRVFSSLICDDEIEVNDDLFDELFQLDEKLKQLWSTNSIGIKKLLRKLTQVATLNGHEIYGWPLKLGGFRNKKEDDLDDSLVYRRQITAFGNGAYIYASQVNHSCAANVYRVFEGDKIVIVVQRPIHAGDQIFDNYGFNFTNYPRETRQAELLKYRFTCDCIACSGNFNLLPSLKIKEKYVLKMAKKYCEELRTLSSVKRAKQRIHEISLILQKHNQLFPCVEICSLMESLQACLEMVLKPDILFP